MREKNQPGIAITPSPPPFCGRTNTKNTTGTFPQGESLNLIHNSRHLPLLQLGTVTKLWHPRTERANPGRALVVAAGGLTAAHHPPCHQPPGQPGSTARDPGTYLAAPRAPTAPSSRAAAGPGTP